MGMFDTVHFTCPHCEKRTSVQSKAGPCDLRDYDELEVPIQILAALDKQKVVCENCGGTIRFSSRFPKVGTLGVYPKINK